MSSIQTTTAQPSSPSPARQRAVHPIVAMVGVIGGQLMLVLDGTIVTVALPHIRTALGFSSAELSWAVNSYVLVFGGLLLLGGRIGDIIGRRRALIIGVTIFALGSLSGGFATEAWMLVAARVVQALGGALAAPSTLALLRTNFAEGPARNRALSLFSLAAGAGGAVGLLLGGYLTMALGWNWVMFINVPIAVIVILAAIFGLTESEKQHGRFDVAGAILSTLGVTALVNGLITAASSGWASPMTIGSLVLGVLVLVAFVLVERRVSHPLLPLRLLSGVERIAPYLSMLLVPAAMFGFFYFTTQFEQNVLHYDSFTTGLAFIPWTAGMFTTSQLAPRMLKRIPVWGLAIAGMTLMPIALFWLSFLSADSSYFGSLFVPLLLLGGAAGVIFLPLTLMVVNSASSQDSSAASGLLQTLQQVGGAIGVAVLTVVFSAAAKGNDAVSQSHGISAALLTSTGIALLSLLSFVSLRLILHRRRRA
jgi:EmrB/QacA subfamily drug resistance transporter